MKPARVQKDTNLHPFVSLSLIAVNSLLWFLLCPALRNIGNRCLAPRRGEHQWKYRCLRRMLGWRDRLGV